MGLTKATRRRNSYLAVYYYQYINKKWQEQQKITDNNAQIAAKFGWAIAADNNWLAIAAPSAGPMPCLMWVKCVFMPNKTTNGY